ncbi:hypothetical protein FACS189441_5490 [Betaproteobacteria bacterium]|nr:hypothetical protein FACS189441_5490 [Betaproteobacteria bacterium]
MVNSTQINFGGHEWVVIGNKEKDIYKGEIISGTYISGTYGGASQPDNSVTLLSRNGDAGDGFAGGMMTTVKFRDRNGGACLGSFAGRCNNYPNEYEGSDLQSLMAGAVPSGREREMINPRILQAMTAALPSGSLNELMQGDGINGLTTSQGQLYWALSLPEWEAIAKSINGLNDYATAVRDYPSSWWLRSPDDSGSDAFAGRSSGELHYDVEYAVFVVRPAFNLDLTSVLFTSASTDANAGKSGVAVGDAYNLMPPSTAQKFTFLDKSISTPELTLTSNALDFNYSVAPTPITGAPGIPGGEKFVSGFLYNGTADAYAKYANTETDPNGSFNAKPASSGTGHELHIFSEEANPYLYSDFASESVDFTFTMNSGVVEDLTLTSNSAFGLDNSSIALKLGETFDKEWSLANGSVLDAFSATFKPSSLNVRGEGNTINGNLDASGGALNFYVSDTTTAGATLLTVSGDANISGSVIRAGIAGNSPVLQEGESVHLLQVAGTLTAAGVTKGTDLQGVSLEYDFDVTPDPITNSLRGVLRKIGINPQTKALSEGFLSGTAFLNQAQDFTVTQGINAALRAQNREEGTGARPQGFAAIGYSSLRHNTGSHIDVDGYTLLAGLAATTPTQTGDLTAAAFIEHGEGDYDSYNSFANATKVHGKGDTSYTGAGILARFAFDETQAAPLYLDASLRSGKVKTDFSGNLFDTFGQAAAYDAKSTYVSAHVGLGYVITLTEQSKLDIYGQYLWSHQNGDTVKLTTGETVKFKAVDSQRTRLGAKFHHVLNAKTTAWLGAAWEHEYDGKAKASANGFAIDAPKLKGDTGLLEMGLTITPATANKQGWSLDFGVQGYAGKREGVTGNLRARYRF